MISVLLQDARCWEAELYLEFAAHDLPPVVALRGVHVKELHADLSFSAMADHGAHSQFSGGLIVRHSEMNLHFGCRRVLFFGQDTHANRTHVRQKPRRKFARWAKQHSPIGGAPRNASAIGKFFVSQGIRRIPFGYAKNPPGPSKARDASSELLPECEWVGKGNGGAGSSGTKKIAPWFVFGLTSVAARSPSKS